eukprot:6813540-Prymnesium_polylepis.2
MFCSAARSVVHRWRNDLLSGRSPESPERASASGGRCTELPRILGSWGTSRNSYAPTTNSTRPLPSYVFHLSSTALVRPSSQVYSSHPLSSCGLASPSAARGTLPGPT